MGHYSQNQKQLKNSPNFWWELLKNDFCIFHLEFLGYLAP